MAVKVAITGIITNGSSFSAGNASAVTDATLNEYIVDGTLTLSGSYGTASSHGDPVDFTGVNPPSSFGGQAPTRVEILEMPQSGVAALGYVYVYCPGPKLSAPTQAGGVLQVLGGAAASGQGSVEITQGSAYSGFTPSLSGAILYFRAWFARL